MSKYDDLRRMREARYSAEPQPAERQQPPTPARQASPAPPLEERAPPPEPKARFDRNAYHREYMRAYMRKRRAKG